MNLCVYCPTGTAGHARYTREFLLAMAEVGPEFGVRPCLVTGADLDPEYASDRYEIHRILPVLRPRSAFPTPLHWAASRLGHYRKREATFRRWALDPRNAIDAVHFQEVAPWLAADLFRDLRRAGIGVFCTVHNIRPHVRKFPGHRALYNACNRRAWRRCDGLFVLADRLVGELSAFLGPGHPPIHVTPHGNWTMMGAGPEPRTEPRRPGRLLNFGAIRRNKGLHVLLEAMADLPEFQLTIAGKPEDPEYGRELREAAERLPAGRVALIDRFIADDELRDLFGASDAFVLPYASLAAQSGVIYDALAFGLPVVATDVGALGETVREWGVGPVVPPNDPSRLAAGIRSLFAPEAYAEAARAVARTRAGWSWKDSARATIEGYLGRTPVVAGGVAP